MTNHELQAAAWTDIYETYKVNQTANGPGSTVEFTKPLREWLPKVLQDNDIYTILDAPCGDLNWIGLINLAEFDYMGWDIEPNMLALNELRYPQHSFFNVNLLTVDDIPQVDLIICRDFLFHLPNEDALSVLDKFKLSGSRLLLTTTHAGADNTTSTREALGEGHDDRPGYWYRPIDIEAAPFNLAGRINGVREDETREMVLVEL